MTRSSHVRPVVATLIVLAGAPVGAAEPAPELYQSHAIVTGTDMRGRPVGFAACLTDVLVKVSGDPKLADDPRVAELAQHADRLVAGFQYRDLYSGIPKHDEQGTRDRPYTLVVAFDPAKIDAVLADLGDQPWTVERPRLAPAVQVTALRGSFVLTGDDDAGRDQRDAFTAAAEKYGLLLVLPSAAAVAAGSVQPASAVPLAGTLVWSDQAGGWVASWRLSWHGQVYAWGVKGVSFDDAYRNAARGALQILSGHGTPDGW
jgi:hypothetical protein